MDERDRDTKIRAARLKASAVLRRGLVHAQGPAGLKTRSVARPARKIASVVQKAAGPAYAKHRHSGQELQAVWPEIVGETLAGMTLPERYQPGTGLAHNGFLTVRVAGALALDLQHMEPQIVERVNAYFGYKAIARLKIVQGPIPNRKKPVGRAALKALSRAEKADIEARALGIADGDLRAALERLGETVVRSRS